MSDEITETIKRVLGSLSALGLTLVLVYFSRFWIWIGPWSSDGLLGYKIISPYGNMVNFWLRGTWWQTFDIVIWGCSAFLLLTALNWLASFSRR